MRYVIMSQTIIENKANYRKDCYIAENITCDNCKDVYLNYVDAYRALSQRDKSRREKKSIYHCSICGHYHLHSKDGESCRHEKNNRVRDVKIHGKKKFLATDAQMKIARNIEAQRFYQIF